MSTLHVADEFSRYLGGRYEEDGEYSGEEFRQRLLLPAVRRALEGQERLVVDFDGVAGIPTSFLEEAFGGLVREWRDASVNKLLQFVSVEAPSTPALWPFTRLASQFMQEAVKERN